jgi:Putative addiction module component
MNMARELIAEALQLDEGQRAALALALMDSLSPSDMRDEAHWIEEIERRARRALSGEELGVDADEAIDRISRDLGL